MKEICDDAAGRLDLVHNILRSHHMPLMDGRGGGDDEVKELG